jgi:COMPASS component SWD2
MRLTETVAQSFQIGKAFDNNTLRITSLDFSADGESLITASDDDSINLYDACEGTSVFLSCSNCTD